jgi:hypothetical protein
MSNFLISETCLIFSILNSVVVSRKGYWPTFSNQGPMLFYNSWHPLQLEKGRSILMLDIG